MESKREGSAAGFGPSEADIRHRNQTGEFVANDSDPATRARRASLLAAWHAYNRDCFGGSMEAVAYIELTPPISRKAWGSYMPVTGIGGKSGIRLLPNILAGTHKHLRSGDAFAEGRDRFLLDVLLHEMVHQFAEETLGKPEAGYRGHGPVFTAECTRIGAMLGLPPVRSMKKRGKDAHLPSCQSWPHNVRPEGYYLGAYIPPAGEDEGDEEGGEAEPTPPEPAFVSVPRDPERMAAAVAALLSADEVAVFTRAFVAAIEAGSAKAPDGGVPIEGDAAAAEPVQHRSGGPARVLTHDALQGGGASETVVRSFRVDPVRPYAQYPS